MKKVYCQNQLCIKIIIVDLEKFKEETKEQYFQCPYCGFMFKNLYKDVRR